MVYLGWFYDFTLAARQHRTILEPETMCGLVKFVHALATKTLLPAELCLANIISGPSTGRLFYEHVRNLQCNTR